MSELAIHNQAGLMPALTIQDAVHRYNAVVEFTQQVMKKDKDYGIIPGTGTKPTLLKPGAEKLCSLFGLVPEFVTVDKITDFDGGLFYFHYLCRLTRNGQLVATGEGSANSKEKKYRYRNIPEWKATDNEKATALRIETRNKRNGGTYQVYVLENQEPFDFINTLQKMAQKRALVAATLIAANASEFFTQDVEDMSIIEGEYHEVVGDERLVAQSKKDPEPEPATNGNRPYSPEIVKEGITKKAEKHKAFDPNENQQKLLRYGLELCFAGDDNADDKRHTVLTYLTGDPSTKNTSGQTFKAIVEDWLKMEKDSGGDYKIDGMAAKEAQTIFAEALKEEGQQELAL